MKRIKVFFLLLLTSFSLFAQGSFFDNKMALESTFQFSPVNKGTGSAGLSLHFKKNVEVGISFLGTNGASGVGINLGFHAKKDERNLYPSVFVAIYNVSVHGSGDVFLYSGSGFLNYRFLNQEKFKSEVFAGVGFSSGLAVDGNNGSSYNSGTQSASSTAFSFGIQTGIAIQRLNIRVGIGKSFSASDDSVGSVVGIVGVGITL